MEVEDEDDLSYMYVVKVLARLPLLPVILLQLMPKTVQTINTTSGTDIKGSTQYIWNKAEMKELKLQCEWHSVHLE